MASSSFSSCNFLHHEFVIGADESSPRTTLAYVRVDFSSPSWKPLLPQSIFLCKHRVERANTVIDSPDSTCVIGTRLLFDKVTYIFQIFPELNFKKKQSVFSLTVLMPDTRSFLTSDMADLQTNLKIKHVLQSLYYSTTMFSPFYVFILLAYHVLSPAQ